MNIVLLRSGKTADVNDSYGLRLVEQGFAVPAPAKKPAPAPKTEKPKAARGKKSEG